MRVHAGLPTDGPHEAFRIGACLRRSHGGLAHLVTFGREDLVEVTRELGIAIADADLASREGVTGSNEQVADVLGYPGTHRLRGHAGQVDASRAQLDEQRHVGAKEQHRGHDEEVRRQHRGAWFDKKARQLVPPLLHAGPSPSPASPRVDRGHRRRATRALQLPLDLQVGPTLGYGPAVPSHQRLGITKKATGARVPGPSMPPRGRLDRRRRAAAR